MLQRSSLRELQKYLLSRCLSLPLCLKTVAIPKSEILRLSSPSNNKFSGLMSLWLTPFLCRYSNPAIS